MPLEATGTSYLCCDPFDFSVLLFFPLACL